MKMLPVRRVVAGALAAASLLVPMSAARAAAPTAGVVTFGIAPATNGKLDGRPYFQFESTPGVTLHDEVAAVNASNDRLHLSIASADATNTPVGGFALKGPNQASTDVGAWIHIDVPPGGLVLPPRKPLKPSLVIVPFTLDVPASATPGDHVGGIFVTLTSSAVNKGQHIHLLQRVGVRVFVRVAGPLHPQLTIKDLSADYSGSFNPFADGSVTVNFTVANTGNAKLSGLQTLSISGLFGARTTVTLPQLPLLIPGGSDAQSYTVHGIYPQGLLTVNPKVTLVAAPGDVDPNAAPASVSTTIIAIPWAIIIAIVILILAAVGWWRWRRRQAARRDAEPSGPLETSEVASDPAPPGDGDSATEGN